MPEEKHVKPQDGGLAVGAYLRYLREAQGMHASEIAEKIGTDPTQVWRVEKWKSDTRSTLLFKYIREVNGDANDVEILINTPTATIQDGETLAKLRLGLLNQHKKK